MMSVMMSFWNPTKKNTGPFPSKKREIRMQNCVFSLRKLVETAASPTFPMVGRARRTAETGSCWHRHKAKSWKNTYVMPRYTRWAGHGVVSCVSLSSSFPARPSPVAFLVRPPSPTLCSSRSPPPTVAPSLRRSNHHVIQIWQARNSNLAGDDYRSGSPRRGLNAGTGPP